MRLNLGGKGAARKNRDENVKIDEGLHKERQDYKYNHQIESWVSSYAQKDGRVLLQVVLACVEKTRRSTGKEGWPD